jgi:hypothetical protein
MDVEEPGYVSVECFQLAQDRNQQQFVVNVIINLDTFVWDMTLR